MPLYSLPSEQLVYQLINEDNPSLPTPVTSSNTKLSDPSVASPGNGSIANSSIRISSRPNSFYIGSKVLTYRRIALADLFKNTSIEIKKYSAASAGTSPFSLYQLLNDLNSRYGLSLTTDDINDAAFPAATDGVYPERTSKVTMTAKATCKAFQGSVDVRWRFDEQLLANIAPNDELDGRVYPFTGNDKYTLDAEAFGWDFTDYAATLNGAAFTGGIAIGNATYVTQHQAIIDALNAFTGKTYTKDAANTGQPYNIYGAICQRYSLPNVAVPEADVTYFNTIVVMTLPTSNPWGVGRLKFQYNT